MTARIRFTLGLLTGLVLTALVLSLSSAAPDIGPSAANTAPAPPSRTQPNAAESSDASLQAILARPLFDPNRHGAASTQPTAATGLPRLSGTLITATGRTAIFALSETDKPIAVPEGGMVRNFRVENITLGHVTLIGPDGRHTLQTAFSAPQPQEAPK